MTMFDNGYGQHFNAFSGREDSCQRPGDNHKTSNPTRFGRVIVNSSLSFPIARAKKPCALSRHARPWLGARLATQVWPLR